MILRTLLFLSFLSTFSITISGQDFCDFGVPNIGADTFMVDFSPAEGFGCGVGFFNNSYSTDFGGFWTEGWAISSKSDIETGNDTNLYSAITGTGSSAEPIGIGTGGATGQYGVGQQDAYILIDDNFYRPHSIDITNTTFTHAVLQEGDEFARPMGGEDGTDPDFFLLTVKGYINGEETGRIVEFFLADYRFLNNDLDYIVDTWEHVDLQPIGQADSITFTLTSSDIGDSGINHPPYFAVDNFAASVLANTKESISAAAPQLYPNPVGSVLNVALPFKNGQIYIFDSYGKLVMQQSVVTATTSIMVANFPKGMYIIKAVNDEGQRSNGKFLKI